MADPVPERNLPAVPSTFRNNPEVWLFLNALRNRVGGTTGDVIYDTETAAQATAAIEGQLLGQLAEVENKLTGLVAAQIEQIQEQPFDPSGLLTEPYAPPAQEALLPDELLGGFLQAANSTAPVQSVFGRTGSVVATEGDYTLNQLGDVTLSSPTTNQILVYNGTNWANTSDLFGINEIRVGENTTLPFPGKISVQNAGTTRIQSYGSGNGTGDVGAFVAGRTRGTFSSPTAVLSADRIGSFISAGYNGTTWRASSAIDMEATENWTSTACGSNIQFETTANGSLTRLVRLTINPSGELGLGTGNSIGVAGQVLTSSGPGAAPTWSTPTTGTVTSVGIIGNDGIIPTGSPITGSGSITLDLDNITPTTVSTGNISTTGYIDQIEILTPAAPAANTLRHYTSDEQGLSVFTTTDSLGFEYAQNRDIFEIARNITGGTINKGEVVYISGVTGNVINIAKARANSLTTMPAIGIAGETIVNNGYGRVMRLGLLKNVDTSAFADGDKLYVSTTTAGAFQVTPPSLLTAYPQLVGIVVRSGVGNGQIAVNVVPELVFDYEQTLTTNHGGTGLTSLGTANQILGVNNAATALEYKSTLLMGLGSTGAPSYSFNGDTNTGIWSPSADIIGFSTGGTERMRILAGNTVMIASSSSASFDGSASQLQLNRAAANSSISIIRNSADTGGPNLNLAKSRGTTEGEVTASVLNGDSLGNILFGGADGTAFLNGAAIVGVASENWSTTARGSRLLFSRALNGSTTRTNIFDAPGNGVISIATHGASPVTGGGASGSLRFVGNITGAASASGLVLTNTVQSDVTGTATTASIIPSTQAAAFTCSRLVGLGVSQGTLGASSAITEQVGISIAGMSQGSTIYGLQSATNAAAGRWNLYISGSANNFLAGKLLINSATEITSNGNNTLFQLNGTANSTSSMSVIRHNTDANGSLLYLGKAKTSTIGDATGAVVANDILGNIIFTGTDTVAQVATSTIRSLATGTWSTTSRPANIQFLTTTAGSTSASVRLTINDNGNVGIGATASTQRLLVGGNSTGGTSLVGVSAANAIQSDVTSQFVSVSSFPSTQAASFTLNTLNHFSATQGTFGAGSNVTTQSGFVASATLVGATNNYGFFGNIPASANNWNFFAGNTAQNYFAGNVGIGSGKTVPATALDVNGTVNATNITTTGSATFGGTIVANNGNIDIQNSANPQFNLVSTGGQIWNVGYNNASGIIGFFDSSASNWGWYTFNGTSGTTLFPRSIDSTSPTTGAVTVTGGVGVGGAVYSGNTIRSTSASGGIGYAAGAGGTVTQATSKATGVTLNTVTGEITMNAAALNANTTVTFTLTNSSIAATDLLVLNHSGAGTFGAYLLDGRCAAGSATIAVRNVTAGSLSEAIIIRFAVIKGATS